MLADSEGVCVRVNQEKKELLAELEDVRTQFASSRREAESTEATLRNEIQVSESYASVCFCDI